MGEPIDGDRLPIEDDDRRVLRNGILKYDEPEAVMAFPVRGGGWWLLDDDGIIGLEASFPDRNVFAELRVAWAWLDANPERQKTARGMKRFLTGWLSRGGH